MNEKTQSLLDRTFKFGVDNLKFLNKLPFNKIYRVPKNQLARSATSIGANYEEAQGSISKRKFIFKIGISYKESLESVYWLRTLRELYPEEIYILSWDKFIKEGNELKTIFASIKKSANEKK